MRIFLLSHIDSRDCDGADYQTDLGVYTTFEKAVEAAKRLNNSGKLTGVLPDGTRDYTGLDFVTEEFEIDADPKE